MTLPPRQRQVLEAIRAPLVFAQRRPAIDRELRQLEREAAAALEPALEFGGDE